MKYKPEGMSEQAYRAAQLKIGWYSEILGPKIEAERAKQKGA